MSRSCVESKLVPSRKSLDLSRPRPQADRVPQATLDLSVPQFQAALRETEACVEDYFASVNDRPVFPKIKGKRLHRNFQEQLPLEPSNPEEVIREFREKILCQSRHNLHPRFFGYVSSPGNPVGALADFLASTINQNVTAWRSAPSAVETELQVIEWIKEIIGYPRDSMGMLMSGGSLATLQALAIAREAKGVTDIFRKGLQSWGHGRMILYMSEEGHMSIPKAAGLLGLGKAFVRTVGVDQGFKMKLPDLQRKINRDRKRGHIPFCVVASAGTVNTGAVDDLDGVARICRREGLWLHVDGAYGGFAALIPDVRERFRGIEKADSVSLDPHKWLFQPLDAGCLLVRNRHNAFQTFSGSGNYAKIISEPSGENFAFFEHGIDLSRRFRALKIWMTLKCYGTRLLSACIAKNLAAAQELKSLIGTDARLEMLAPVELSIVCFRYVPVSMRQAYRRAGAAQRRNLDRKLNDLNQGIMHRLQRGGRVYLSNAMLRGRFALRACILSYRTEKRDVKILVDEVVRVGRLLEGKF